LGAIKNKRFLMMEIKFISKSCMYLLNYPDWNLLFLRFAGPVTNWSNNGVDPSTESGWPDEFAKK
jgi:hypothetical protein